MLLKSGAVSRAVETFKTTFLGARRAIEDVIVSMIPQAVSVVTGFVATILIARGLGPAGMGNYALILSVSGLAAALSDLGIGQTAIRFASRAAETNNTERQLAVLRWAFRLRILLLGITSITAFAFAPVIAGRLWHEATLAPLVRVSLLAGVFAALAAIPTIYFQSVKRFGMNAVVATGQSLISLTGIIFLAILDSWSLHKVILVSVIAAGMGAVTFLVLVPKACFIKWQEFRQPLSKLPKMLLHAPTEDVSSPTTDSTGANTFAFFMVLASILVTVAMRADVWLMGFYLDKDQIGLYSVASRFTLPLVILLGALNTALWPRASALNEAGEILAMMGKTFRLSVLVAIAALLYSILAPLATPYLFGSRYANGILLGQVLCIRYCVSLLVCPIGVIGYSLGLVRVYWLINLIQLLAVVGINMILLPRYGAIGSAVALIANEALGCLFTAVIMWRRISRIKSGNAHTAEI